MVYNFKINIVVRLGILLLLILGIALSLENGFHLTTGFGVILSLILIYNLFNYVDQTNKDLANFFESIQYNDFNTTGSGRHRGDSFGDLHEGFNLINRKFRDIRAEKEANHQFLQTVVEHVEVGLLCIDEDGEVVLMNKALQRLLRKSYLVNLSGLKKIDEQLWEAVTQLNPGDRELLKLNIDNRLMQIAVRTIDLILNKENLKLISFQNIQSELEAQELVAYQKLIRILTHEIMNSVTPISSLASTLIQLESQGNSRNEDVLTGLQTIERRSRTLLKFVDDYRKLASIPAPVLKPLDLADFLTHLEELYAPELNRSKIALTIQKPAMGTLINADEGLLNQVFANLMSNSIYAVRGSENARVSIHCQKLANTININFSDNGEGISESKLGEVFVPFYSSKTTGSGIGLSLCKQIMHLHGGSITANSSPSETTFTLNFDIKN